MSVLWNLYKLEIYLLHLDNKKKITKSSNQAIQLKKLNNKKNTLLVKENNFSLVFGKQLNLSDLLRNINNFTAFTTKAKFYNQFIIGQLYFSKK